MATNQATVNPSCPRCYSQIEGLGLHGVNITRYQKHLHNRFEIIELESQGI